MIKLTAVAGFALTVATSAEAMTPAPSPQPDRVITQVAASSRGRIPARTHREPQRLYRCESWHGDVCRRWVAIRPGEARTQSPSGPFYRCESWHGKRGHAVCRRWVAVQ